MEKLIEYLGALEGKALEVLSGTDEITSRYQRGIRAVFDEARDNIGEAAAKIFPVKTEEATAGEGKDLAEGSPEGAAENKKAKKAK